MGWFKLGDVPHTRRRGVVLRHQSAANADLVDAILENSSHHDSTKIIFQIKIDTSNHNEILFEVWQHQQRPGGPDWNGNPSYTVFFVWMPVTPQVLDAVCSADLGRGTRRNWPSDT